MDKEKAMLLNTFEGVLSDMWKSGFGTGEIAQGIVSSLKEDVALEVSEKIAKMVEGIQ